MGIGFTADLKISKEDAEKNVALDKWIQNLNILFKKYNDSFNDVINLAQTEKTLTDNVIRGRELLEKKIKPLVSYIMDYSIMNGINIKEYVRKFYSNEPYLLNWITNENNRILVEKNKSEK